MSTIIQVENLSKRYRLGLAETRKDTLAQQIVHSLASPLRNFQRLRNMTKFDQEDESVFWALKGINFSVQEGEVLGVIGHNGAGKSTLLKLLSKITEPTTGQISLKGRVAALLEVGTGFHQDLTGRENIYMNGTILGMTRNEIDQKLDEIVDFSGVERHIDTPVKFYSSGMKVRLGFSVAAHLEPEILIIDEVLAVGDAEFQRKCLGKMETVAGHGRTVIFVSHNMDSVRKLCTRSLLLSGGILIEEGTPQEVISSYISKVQRKMNPSFENLIDSEVERSGSGQLVLSKVNIKESPDNYSVESKSPLTFEIEYVSTIQEISNIRYYLDISFKTRDELMVFKCETRAFYGGASIARSSEKLSCQIEKLPLYPGEYIVDFILKEDGKSIDAIKNQFYLKVNGTHLELKRLQNKPSFHFLVDYRFNSH